MSIGYRKIMTYFIIANITCMTHKLNHFKYVTRVYPIATKNTGDKARHQAASSTGAMVVR